MQESMVARRAREVPDSKAAQRTRRSSWTSVVLRSVMKPARDVPRAGEMLAVAAPARTCVADFRIAGAANIARAWRRVGRMGGKVSQNEHAVAVREEAVFLGDGVAVGGEGEFGTGEGADEEKQGGLRKVEVGQHAVDALEFEAWVDEEIGIAGVAAADEGLDGADGGGADGEEAFGGGDFICGFFIDEESFGVEVVFFDGLRLQGLEGPEADMEGDGGDCGALFAAGGEGLGCEMKAGGGGGDGAGFLGVDGLVAFGVGFGIGAADVGRQRDVAVGLDGGPGVRSMEADVAFTGFCAVENFGVEVIGELDFGSWREFLAGFDQGEPFGFCDVDGVDEENFDFAGEAGAVAEEAGGKDAGVVEDEGVIFG